MQNISEKENGRFWKLFRDEGTIIVEVQTPILEVGSVHRLL